MFLYALHLVSDRTRVNQKTYRGCCPTTLRPSHGTSIDLACPSKSSYSLATDRMFEDEVAAKKDVNPLDIYCHSDCKHGRAVSIAKALGLFAARCISIRSADRENLQTNW